MKALIIGLTILFGIFALCIYIAGRIDAILKPPEGTHIVYPDEDVFMQNDCFTEEDEHSPSQLDIDTVLKLIEVRKQIEESNTEEV
jgi:hypothetical protein